MEKFTPFAVLTSNRYSGNTTSALEPTCIPLKTFWNIPEKLVQFWVLREENNPEGITKLFVLLKLSTKLLKQ